MIPPHVLDLLPLWVEGDLPAADQAAVDAHLAQCPACREAADRLHQSQAWLREALEPPFTDAEMLALGAGVLAAVAVPAPSFRRRWLGPSLLAAAAGLAWMVQGRRDAAPGPPPTFLPAPPAAVSGQPPPQAKSETPLPRRPSRASPPEPSPPALARLEFQTADPTIRIIWLSNQPSGPSPEHPSQEQP